MRQYLPLSSNNRYLIEGKGCWRKIKKFNTPAHFWLVKLAKIGHVKGVGVGGTPAPPTQMTSYK
jgi:hypothetical protein